MWFKQVQLFQLTSASTCLNDLSTKLEPLVFHSCLPAMSSSMGWVSPLEIEGEETFLTREMNGYIIFCLQIEEKILPASVVNLALKNKIKHIESTESRKIRQKEKLLFRDEITQTLLPKAFSKLTRVYAYIDKKNAWLILNTVSHAKTELFISMFKKCLDVNVNTFELINPAFVMTNWLQNKDYPSIFSIEKSCLLQDSKQQNRIIRCQHQDLFDISIQSLIKNGCEVKQVALCWQDRLHFILTEDFSIRSIQLNDDVIGSKDQLETPQHKFDADFFMMTSMFTKFFHDLFEIFKKQTTTVPVRKFA
jgi:recombination associated protein RdgC